MAPSDQEPQGATQMPKEQPKPDAANLSNQAAFRTSKNSRWLAPAGLLAAVAIVLFCFAFQIQIVLPIIGILFVAGMWIAMALAARTGGHNPRTTKRLAWLMSGMAVGALLIAIGIYIVESTRLPWT